MTAETERNNVTVYLKGADPAGIPFDVFSSLSGAISLLYPNAQMGPGEYGRGLSLIVSPEDRKPRRPSKRAIAKAHEPLDPDEPAMGVVGYEDGALQFTTGEEAIANLAEWAYIMLTAGDQDPENYVEFSATHPENKRRLSVVACWSPRQTPHELRMKAEARAEAAEAEVERLKAALVTARSYHGNSIDPDECMECADHHMPCRTATLIDGVLDRHG